METQSGANQGLESSPNRKKSTLEVKYGVEGDLAYFYW